MKKYIADAESSARFALLNLSDKQLANEGSVVEVVKREVRAVFKRATGKKPIINVHLIYM